MSSLEALLIQAAIKDDLREKICDNASFNFSNLNQNNSTKILTSLEQSFIKDERYDEIIKKHLNEALNSPVGWIRSKASTFQKII